MSWQIQIQELAQPWATWLANANLFVTKTDVAILVVPEKEMFFYSSLEVLNKCYVVSKQLYPKITSLLVVSGFEYDLVLSGDLAIHDVKVNVNV